MKKRQFQWMSAAIIVCGLASVTMTSCFTGIDNPVVNGDVESNSEFLRKTREGVRSLAAIYEWKKDDPQFLQQVSLLDFYGKVRRLGLDAFAGWMYRLWRPVLEKEFLKGKHVSMNAFAFYKLGLLSGKFKTSFPAQQDAFGHVETDELVLSAAAQAYRYRLKFYGDAELLLLAVSGVRAPFIYDEKTATHVPVKPNIQQVPVLSQMEQDPAHKRRICSPCSLYMALNALGYVVPLQQILPRVFDQTADIYGNWLFNIAAASEFGAEAFFRRFASLAELEEFVTPDSLVMASIAFKKDELPGAPLEKTSGHLVVVRGYEKNKILVADPAAPTAASVLRSYNAAAFANVWLNHKQGAAYVVRRK